eukprot:Gb_12550 [translate_table: standard]
MYRRSQEKKLNRLASSDGSSGSVDLNAITAGSSGSQVTCTNRARRLTIQIVEAKDLKKRASGSKVKAPLFKFKVEGLSQKSKEIENFVDHDGVLKVDQSFTFDVKDPKNAVLSIKVHGKGLFGLENFIGTCENMPLKNLLESSDGIQEVESKWYDLYSKDRKKKLAGKILMHIVVGAAEPEQRVRVFVGTWNVGNSRPSPETSLSLKPYYVNSGSQWTYQRGFQQMLLMK